MRLSALVMRSVKVITSLTPTIEASVVAMVRIAYQFIHGGSIRFTHCGTMIIHSVWRRLNASEAADSHWAVGIDWIAPRTISDTFAMTGSASPSVAFDQSGSPRGGMGCDWACFLNDERLGLAIGNFANEMTALYVSDQPASLQFSDLANLYGLGAPTQPPLKFGLFFFDYDLDGRLDLLSANGHLEPDISKVQASETYEQPVQLYRNRSTHRPRSCLRSNASMAIVPSNACWVAIRSRHRAVGG